MIVPDFRIFFTHLKDENPHLGLWGKKKSAHIDVQTKFFDLLSGGTYLIFLFGKKPPIIYRNKFFLDIYIFYAFLNSELTSKIDFTLKSVKARLVSKASFPYFSA